jgi:hypothetical protein
MKKNNIKYIVAIIISLIIGVSIFSHGYLDYKYKKEALEKKTTSEEKAKLDQEKVRLQTQIDLENCLTTAEENYNNNWNNECESQGLLSKPCIKLLKLSFNDYVTQSDTPKDNSFEKFNEYIEKQEKCSCRLPVNKSDRLEQRMKDARNECYQKYQK